MSRRLMLRNAPIGPEWDYEWDYSMGLLSENGFTKNASGNASETLASNGVKLTYNGGSIKMDANRVMRVGVLEVDAIMNSFSTSSSARNFNLCLSNGVNGIRIFIYGGSSGIKIYNNSVPASCPTIGNWSRGIETTFRLKLNGETAAVYKDGALLQDNVPISNMFESTETFIGQIGAGESVIRAVRMKIGRLI